MSEFLNITHQDFSLEEVSQLVTDGVPVRRGVHVGNQKPHDLVVECHLPKGVDVWAADTINGNDRRSRPRYIRFFDCEIPLAADKYRTKMVTTIPIKEHLHDKLIEQGLSVLPQPDETVAAFHMRAILALEPANPPVLVSEFFAQHNRLYRAVVGAAANMGERMRTVTAEGSIRETTSLPQAVGIFGLDDSTSSNSGILPSLNVMMVMDILTAVQAGADRSLHLGGSAMAEYTGESERMACVGKLVAKVAHEMGFDLPKYAYVICDVTSFGNSVDPRTYTSQYELLRSRAALERV